MSLSNCDREQPIDRRNLLSHKDIVPYRRRPCKGQIIARHSRCWQKEQYLFGPVHCPALSECY
jgi:hypothetical protein